MKVLVTGAEGFIGSRLLPPLLERGHRVTGLRRLPCPAGNPPHRLGDRFRWVDADLSDAEAVARLPGDFDAVIHAAGALAQVGDHPEILRRDNAEATRQLALFAERAGIARVVYLSSVSVYGRIESATVDENTPIREPGLYGHSKYEGERALVAVAERVATVALRLPAVLGPRPVSHWPGRILAAVLAGRAVEIFNPEAPFNNAVHVADLARWMPRLLEKSWRGFVPLVPAPRDPAPVREIAERMIRRARSESRVVVAQASSAPFTNDPAKAVGEFGFEPLSVAAMFDLFVDENIEFGPEL